MRSGRGREQKQTSLRHSSNSCLLVQEERVLLASGRGGHALFNLQDYGGGLLEIAFQKSFEGFAVTGFVAGHLMYGVMYRVMPQLSRQSGYGCGVEGRRLLFLRPFEKVNSAVLGTGGNC